MFASPVAAWFSSTVPGASARSDCTGRNGACGQSQRHAGSKPEDLAPCPAQKRSLAWHRFGPHYSHGNAPIHPDGRSHIGGGLYSSNWQRLASRAEAPAAWMLACASMTADFASSAIVLLFTQAQIERHLAHRHIPRERTLPRAESFRIRRQNGIWTHYLWGLARQLPRPDPDLLRTTCGPGRLDCIPRSAARSRQ